MNINMTPKTASHAAPLCADIASRLLFFPVLTCKAGVDGCVAPCSRSAGWVYFPPRVSRAGGTEASPAPLEPPTHHHPPPGPGVPCGSPCPTNTWQINQTHCWQPLTVKAGGWGITWKEWYSWQIFFHGWWKKNTIWRRGSFFFFEGKTVCSLNTLRLNEKFPHVLNIWKVSLLAADKRQSCAASGSSAGDTLRGILVFVRRSDSFTENNSPSPLLPPLTPHTHSLCLRPIYAIFNGKAIDRVVWS